MGLRRAFKKITKGLRKAVKSKFGKILIAGALLYAGGAFGGKAAGAASGGAGAGAGAAGGATAAGATAASAVPAVAEAAGAATTAAKSGGLISNAIKSIGGFVEKNPMASSMIFNAAASALSPDETELMEEQEKIRRNRYRTMEVPNSIGMSPGGIINRGIRQ